MPPHERPPGLSNRHGPEGSPPEPIEIDLEALAKETEDMLQLRYIDKDNAVFSRTDGGFVSLKYCDKEYDRIAVYCAFPFTDPEKYISIREANDKAREIGIIKDLSELSKDTAKILKEQLAIRYFTPVITKINDIKDEYGFAYFDVVTDRGDCKFTIRMGGGSVVTLSETRLLISDLDGNRFEVPDTGRLSAGELKKLDLFI